MKAVGRNTFIPCLAALCALIGCEPSTRRVAGEACQIDLHLHAPRNQDPLAGLVEISITLLMPNGDRLSSRLDAALDEAVLNGPRANGVSLILEGLDETGRVAARGRSALFDLDPENTVEVRVLVARVGETVLLGELQHARFGHTASVLADGRILVFGGASAGDPATPADLVPPEMFDPLTGQACTFGQAGCPTVEWSGRRMDHTATTTAQGTVLIFGGHDQGQLVQNVLVFDPAIDRLRLVRSSDSGCILGRVQHAAVAVHRDANVPDNSLLPVDSVLISGGLVNDPDERVPTRSSLLFDAWDEVFVGCDQEMTQARAGHSLTATTDGGTEVLAIGGRGSDGLLSTVERFDGQRFVALQAEGEGVRAGLETARQDHATVRMEDNRLLVIGGQNDNGDLDSVELYWSEGGHSRGFFSLGLQASSASHVGRHSPLVAPLSSRRFLVAGGQALSATERQSLKQVEQLEITEDYTEARYSDLTNPEESLAHAALALYRGGVLFVGGLRDDPNGALASRAVWYYNPP